MLYLVLDTNVLISHCQFLVELKDYAIKGVGRPILVIPWAVMQELDALKTRDNEGLATKARHAIAVLHSCFSANHPRVRGQTMEEVRCIIFASYPTLHCYIIFSFSLSLSCSLSFSFCYRFKQSLAMLPLVTMMTESYTAVCSSRIRSKVMVVWLSCSVMIFSCVARHCSMVSGPSTGRYVGHWHKGYMTFACTL